MSRNIFMIAVILTMAFVTLPAQAGRINITQALLEQPEAVQVIGIICQKICMGNNRKSWLQDAWVDILEGPYSIAELSIRLRHKHSTNLFGGFTVYQNHNTLKVKARLNNETCEVSVLYEEIEFTNALYQATLWLTRQLDKLFDFLPSIKEQLPIC